MPTLKIKRVNTSKLRDCKIYVNGRKIGSILNGETKHFNIDHGKNIVVCKIDWWSSSAVTLNFANEEARTLEVSSLNQRWFVPLIIFIGLGLQLLIPLLTPWLKQNSPNFKVYLLFIPIVTLLILYIAIGRKKKVALREI